MFAKHSKETSANGVRVRRQAKETARLLGCSPKRASTANGVAPALISTNMITEIPNIHDDVIPIGRFAACKHSLPTNICLV